MLLASVNISIGGYLVFMRLSIFLFFIIFLWVLFAGIVPL